MTIYCHSGDQELFREDVDADSREEAVRLAAAEYKSGAKFYLGVRCDLQAETYVDGDDILETIACRVYDHVGEVAEGWPDASDAQEKALTEKLQRLVREWMEECGQVPTFYAVEEVTEHLGTSLS